MVKRRRLAWMVRSAWEKCVNEQYVRQTVNSEAALQTWFCTYLHEQINSMRLPWRLFVEPRVVLDGEPGPVFPDVLVCNEQRAIGAIELKYLPRGEAKFVKDMQSLSRLAAKSGKGGVSVSNERYRGPNRREKRYELAADALLVWAAISAKEIESSRIRESFDSAHLLLLQSLTHDHAAPTLLVDPALLELREHELLEA